MKIKIIVCLLLICHQLRSQNFNEQLIGDWYLVQNHWTIIEDVELSIKSDSQILFRQTVFVNPCNFKKIGSVSNDTIIYTQKLYCLNRTHTEMKYVEETTEKYLIISLDDNNLTLLKLKGNKVLNYQKKNDFSNLFYVLLNRSWKNNKSSFSYNHFSIKVDQNKEQVADSLYSIWKFKSNGKLIIEDINYIDTLTWVLSSDSIMELSFKTVYEKKRKYKIHRLSKRSPEMVLSAIPIDKNNYPNIPSGVYRGDYNLTKRNCILELKDNFYFHFRKSGVGVKGSYYSGYYEVKDDIIILHPYIRGNADVASVWGYKITSVYKDNIKLVLKKIKADNSIRLIYEWEDNIISELEKN